MRKPVSRPDGTPPLDETPPEHLPDSAADAYVATVRALNGLGIGTTADLGLIEAYALALGLLRDAADDVRREGLTVVDERGIVRKHPSASIVNAQQSQVRALAPLLGLTPTARAGMDLPKPGDGEGGSLAELVALEMAKEGGA
jgi:P27 family predicted phage terminase small subunit